jgi:hypothetical protein
VGSVVARSRMAVGLEDAISVNLDTAKLFYLREWEIFR